MFWYTWSSSYSANDLFDYTGLIRHSSAGPYESQPALAAYAASARRAQGCRQDERRALPARARAPRRASAGGLGIRRVADRAHDDDAPGAGRDNLATLPASIPPMANQGRSPACAAAWRT